MMLSVRRTFEVEREVRKPGEAVCALCHEPGELRRSHIIPEFFYKPVYDETHRFLQSSTDPADRVLTRQKGLREYLLCQRCETKLSGWETYASKVIKGGLELQGLDGPRCRLCLQAVRNVASVACRHRLAS